MLVLLSGFGYLFVQYQQLNQSIRHAYVLSDAESHQEAIGLLRASLNNPSLYVLNRNSQQINTYILDITLRERHQDIYKSGLESERNGNRSLALSTLESIPKDSFYHYRATSAIEGLKRLSNEESLKIVKAELSETASMLDGAEQKIQKLEEEKSSLSKDLNKALSERAVARSAQRDAEDEAASQKLAKEKAQFDSDILQDKVESGDRALILEMSETHPQIKAIVSGKLNVYFDPLPSYADSSISNVVTNVMAAFATAHLYGASVNRVYNENSADMHITWIKDYGTHTLGVAIYKSVIEIGLGSTNCKDDWAPFDANTVTRIMWHELGHSMGYGHSSDPNNVMYPSGGTRYIQEQIISDILPAGYYRTYGLCDSGSYSYSFQTSDAYGSGFNIYVLPPGEDPNVIGSGGGLVYTSCGAQTMITFSGQCNVPLGALIYIGNASYNDTIQLSGTIINMDEPLWPDMTWDESAFEYSSTDLDEYWRMFN
ncbi:MAG: matrixin family metalloprotease [Chloroflexota bacterium]|nr:matrixin family metalloprotease [Chloroflexota bacterium]